MIGTQVPGNVTGYIRHDYVCGISIWVLVKGMRINTISISCHIQTVSNSHLWSIVLYNGCVHYVVPAIFRTTCVDMYLCVRSGLVRKQTWHLECLYHIPRLRL